ncbi:hypothetical protein POTOM_011255 [Populus tomentosa]|uniref:Uncharacterized protein n=1 Tax=Populus tomentosa TaxID=118781 RepID=A0A8X8AIR6_POPTO|nr:hypothetical protein POTOM_011255 [Populus tomentosa]
MASGFITPIPFHIFINDLASSRFYHMIHELTARLRRTDLQQNCRLTTYIAHLGCFISSFLSSKGILAITLSDAMGARHLQEECALKILQIQPSSFSSLQRAFHMHPLENDLHLLQKRSSPG